MTVDEFMGYIVIGTNICFVEEEVYVPIFTIKGYCFNDYSHIKDRVVTSFDTIMIGQEPYIEVRLYQKETIEKRIKELEKEL